MKKNKNVNSTRYYSDLQENSVAKVLNGLKVANSGAGKFSSGDVVVKGASMLVECKTTTTEKKSFSVKRDVLEKTKLEAFSNRLSNTCLCFDFGPNTDRYYVIDENLMKFLIEKLEEEDL